MTRVREFIQYFCVSTGMALAVSCLVVIGGLYRYVSGAAVAAAVILAGVACLAVAAAVAELASRYPAGLGIRSYLKHAFGERLALVLTFLYLLMLALVAGVEAVVVAQVFAPLMPSWVGALLPGLLLLAVLGLNIAGIELSRRVQTVTTLLMIAGIGLIAITALAGPAAVETWPTAVESGSWMGLGSAVALAVFLFTGFEWVTPLGRSPLAYRRMIPLAMLTAVTVLGLLYILFGLALGHVGASAEDRVPHVALARLALGSTGVPLVVVLTLLAIFTSFNAGILGASRLIYGIAREGQLPRWCARVYLRTGAPVGALSLITGLAAVSMALVVAYRLELAAAAVAAAIVAVTYGALLLATARLRAAREDAPAAGFTCPIPSGLLYAGALGLLLLGGGALLSDPRPHMPLAAGLLLLSIGAVVGGTGKRRPAAARCAHYQPVEESNHVL